MKEVSTAFPGSPAAAGRIPQTAARISMIAASATVLLVALLHLLKPDQHPAWHMVSEYAIGDYGWVMQLAFYCWALSCFALAMTVRTQVASTGGKFGIWLLVLVSLGITMAGIFVIDAPTTPKDQLTQHGNLHAFASLIGVPGLPIAAMLISHSLVDRYPWKRKRKTILTTGHLTWITLLMMVGSIVLMAVTNGGKFGPGAVVGWANRIWILASCGWLIAVSRLAYAFAATPAHRVKEMCDVKNEELL